MISCEINLDVIAQIMSEAGKIEGLERETLKKMLLGSMFNENKYLCTDIEDGQMRAFMYATIETLDGADCAFIHACHSDKEGVVQNMLDGLIQWSKKLGLKKIIFMTKRNPKAWQRKYKFNESYKVMTREI